MIGASLSRWTMSYFFAAFVALLAAEIALISGIGFPAEPFEAPETLIVVHLVTIGWLSLLLTGAMCQFVPVLVARPLAQEALTLPALVLIVFGLGGLLLGFLAMSGTLTTPIPWLPVGGTSLLGGFAMLIWCLGRTLWSGRPLALPSRFIAIGLLALAGTVGLGVLFTLVLSGQVSDGSLADIATRALPFHAAMGLGGWATFSAMGVGYRLLAMFMLAPERQTNAGQTAFAGGAIGIAALFAGAMVCPLIGVESSHPLIVALAGASVAVNFYGFDIYRLFRDRRRRKMELNTRMAARALAILGVSLIALVTLAAFDRLDRYIGAITFLFVFGWLTGLGLAKLHKIVAFLTWLECFGPIMGRGPTPRVQDLVDDGDAGPWFDLYFASVAVATAAAALHWPWVFRSAAAAMFVATLRIGIDLVRTRRLRRLHPTVRLDAPTPSLFFATSPPA